MALDTWLLEGHRQGQHPPTLRFYTWSSPTISLGYHQRRYPAHWCDLRWNDAPVELVGRPTGGRAVLHGEDLTYSLVSSGWKGDRAQVYRQLCGFLIAGWRSLGVLLHFGERDRGSYMRRASCFATATGADLLTATGEKLIGSAQLWRGHAVLQQGSMQLQPNLALQKTVFGIAEAAPELPWQNWGEHPRDRIVSQLVRAAEDEFKIEFDVRPLSQAECQDVAAIADSSRTH